MDLPSLRDWIFVFRSPSAEALGYFREVPAGLANRNPALRITRGKHAIW
jgi:hypothetical protein